MAQRQPAYGLNQPTQNIFPAPIVSTRAPTSGDIKYEIGQQWVYKTTGAVYALTAVAAGAATWSLLGPGASDVDTLTGDSGGAIGPSGGNITLAGGTNITTVGSGSTITSNLDSSISLTTVTATTVNGTTFDTNVAAAGLTMAGTTIAADGTDANIDINLTPKGTGAVAVTGDLNVTGDLGFTGALTVTGQLDVDNLELNGNTISSTDTNGDINLTPDGTGTVVVGTDLDVDNINIDGNTISSTDTNGAINFTPDGSGTTTITAGGLLVSAGDVINSHSDAGTDVTVEVTNSDNTNAASRAGFEVATGGTSSGDPYVNFLISGGQSFTMGIDNSATNDDFVISDAATLGTNNRISIDGSSGDVSIPTSDLAVTRAGGAGTAVQASVINTDNTNADSPAVVAVTSGGTSGGDAYASFLVTGGQQFCVGIDNSTTNDDFVISDGAAPGTGNRISIDGSSGDTSITGNLLLSSVATQLQMNGGAVTDFIGQATLSSGTVTVANTNIAAGDRIICTRSDINGSTALGVLVTAISAGADFTITAVQPGTPASAQTNDTSIVDYIIVRQN